MTKPKKYTARYTFEDGNWLVELGEIPQVHTFGRTLAKAQANIRDALALWVQADDASILDIRDDFGGLPTHLTEAVAQANQARAKAAELSERAQELTSQAAKELVDDLGMPIRDAARLLHVSHQRIHQLVQGEKRRSA